MSKPTVLITCAGDYSHLHETPKHFWTIEDVPVLERTVNQLTSRGIRPVIAASDRETFNVFPDTDYLQIDGSRFWVETVLQTRHLWRGQVVCLLGDVFFSDECIDRALASDGFKLLGRTGPSRITGAPGGEPFAMCWHERDADRWVQALEAGLEHAIRVTEKNPHMQLTGLGIPYQPYRHLIGCPMHQHVTDNVIWFEQNDFTDDFDNRVRYKHFCLCYAKRWIRQGPPAKFDASKLPILED